MEMAQHLQYDFLAPPKVVFGWGRRTEAGSLAKSLGRRAFIISGSRTLERRGTLDELCKLLQQSGVEPVRASSVTHEPEVSDVDSAAARLREHGAGPGD